MSGILGLMRRRSCLIVVVCLVLFGRGHNFLSQEITVRLIDIHSGRPLANRPLDIHFRAAPTDMSPWFEVWTGADGIAKVHVPNPTPSQIAVVQMPASPALYPCIGLEFVDTEEVIAHGLVLHCPKPPQGCPCKFRRQVTQIMATPGELVEFARDFHWWEKLLRHVWE